MEKILKFETVNGVTTCVKRVPFFVRLKNGRIRQVAFVEDRTAMQRAAHERAKARIRAAKGCRFDDAANVCRCAECNRPTVIVTEALIEA